MIELNLLPDIKKDYINAKKTKAVVISSSVIVTLGAFGLSILLFVYVSFIQTLQIGLATGDIRKKSDTLNGIQDITKYLTIQNQLAALPRLHDNKGAYSRLFTFLPIFNPSEPNSVKLSSLQVSLTDKTIIFSGTTGVFESLNIFADTLRNAQASYRESGATTPKTDRVFDSVFVQNSALTHISGVALVSFTIKTVYHDAVFDARNTDVTASVPNIKTTQSITESPRPVFDNSQKGGQ